MTSSVTVAFENDSHGLPSRAGERMVVRTVYAEGNERPAIARTDRQWAALRFQGFDGRCARVAVLDDGERTDAPTVVLGFGSRDRVTTDSCRTAAATLARRSTPGVGFDFYLPADLRIPTCDAVRSVAEGLELGWDLAGTNPKPAAAIVVPGELDKGVVAACDEGIARARATIVARALCNRPPNSKTPESLAEITLDITRGMATRVLADDEIERAGYGGIAAVGAGSAHPPRLVEIDYRPADADGHIVLVGKGITFDAGGLCLKAPEWLPVMKADMAGAAAVIGVMSVLPSLGLPVRVTAVLPFAENMPSGSAYRPGDVLTLGNGTTVEVMDTDAEGRIVLADGLVHACRMRPDAVIDLGTLSASCVSALGDRYTVLSSNDSNLHQELTAAGRDADEPICAFPLPADLPAELRSTNADLVNRGPAAGDAIYAATFLREFVDDDLPWAHLDLIGPAWSTQDSGYRSPGATGAGARTLIAWLQKRFGTET